MEKAKRFLSFIAVVMVLLMAFGCTQSDNNNNDAAGTSTGEAPVTVTFSTYQVREQERVEDAIKVFGEKYPYITVDVTFLTNEQFDSIMNTKFAAGDASDIVQLALTPERMAWGKAGYLLDLSDNSTFKKVTPSVASACDVDGKVYMLPTNVALLGLFVNTKVLADAGVSIPTNYGEFLAACEAVKKIGKAPIAFGDKDGVQSGWGCKIVYDSITSQSEVQGIVDRTKKFSDSAAFKELLTKIKELEQKGYFVDGWSGISLDDAHAMIGNAEAAFMFSAEWNFPGVLAANPDAQFALVPMPFNDSGTPRIISTIGGGVGVNANAKVLDAALKWLEFNGTQDYADAFKFDGTCPVEGVKVTLSKEAQAAYDNYTANISPDPVGKLGFKNANFVFQNSVQSYLLTNASIQDVCERAESVYDTGK